MSPTQRINLKKASSYLANYIANIPNHNIYCYFCCCSVAELCPTLCNPMDCNTPGFPVLHYLPEFTQIMSIELVMPSNHLILCHPLLLLPSILLSIRVFSNDLTLHIRWPKYWTFSFSISPSNEYSGLISFRTVWLHLLAVQGIPDTGIGDKKRHNHKICETKH